MPVRWTYERGCPLTREAVFDAKKTDMEIYEDSTDAQLMNKTTSVISSLHHP